MFNEFVITLVSLNRKIECLNNKIKIELEYNVDIFRDYIKIKKQNELN